MLSIELLAPAKDIKCGMAAIDHGADAVYIGAERFGARSAAGNPIGDIARLCGYAHTFGAKVYVTVNTIVYDEEHHELEELLARIDESGADAILAQDMAIPEIMGTHRRMALHASTQTDNRDARKVEWLRDAGFSRVVLARELSLQEISDIHQKVPDVELEAFVHGALCVSYSGACYASQHCFGRSANRGECAQFCRLMLNLNDAEGKTILKGKFPLSLKDMCRVGDLERLMDAGVSSLKIEGRLKGVSYVKNVVSAYNAALEDIIRRNPDKYRRASFGHVSASLKPELAKSFNRGFTDYFLYGRSKSMSSMDSPKSRGEYVGTLKSADGKSLTVAGTAAFANGDGLCFISSKAELEGFRVNKAEGNRLFPMKMPTSLQPGTRLYRNYDKAFEDALSNKTAERRLYLNVTLSYADGALRLDATDETKRKTSVTSRIDLAKSIKPQSDNIRKQLGKLGGTPYQLFGLDIDESASQLFIPSSVLSEMRRETVRRLTSQPINHPDTSRASDIRHCIKLALHADELHAGNVSNHIARRFYDSKGLTDAANAVERSPIRNIHTPLMTCRYCIKHELGYCVRHGGNAPMWKEPLSLETMDGREFTIEFECKHCQMKIYAKK